MGASASVSQIELYGKRKQAIAMHLLNSKLHWKSPVISHYVHFQKYVKQRKSRWTIQYFLVFCFCFPFVLLPSQELRDLLQQISGSTRLFLKQRPTSSNGGRAREKFPVELPCRIVELEMTIFPWKLFSLKISLAIISYLFLEK